MNNPEVPPEVPVVLWHQRGSENRHSYCEIARATIENLIKLASYDTPEILLPNHTVAGLFVDDVQPEGSRNFWTAYACPPDAAGNTEELMALNYKIWLAWTGSNSALQKTFRKAMQRDTRDTGYRYPADVTRIIGRIVFPDVINGQLPGTLWLPNKGRLDAPAWPKLPSKEDVAIAKRRLDHPEQA